MRRGLTERAYRAKAKRFFSVLLPIFVTQIALTATGFFDTVMSGHVSEQDLAGVAVGSNLFMPFFGSFLGIISVLTPIVAQLHGAGKRERIDFLLAVGGGSVVDGSKFVAAAACFEGADPWEILLHKAPIKAALPLGCVLTLPATGSESNPAAVVSRGEAKLSFMNPLVQPVFAVLDPTTTYSLPPRQVGNGVVDAFVHIIEQYLTFPVGGEVQDRLAEGLLQVLVDNGPRALAEPTNYQVRANLMWAASLALNGLIGRGVPQDWSTHAIGHQLTALHGLDHAQSLAVVLPSLLREQSAQKQEKLAQFAERVWHSSREDKALRIEEAIIRTEQFFQQMGVGTRLADYGLSESCIPGICSNLKRFGLTALGEQQDIDPDKVARILSHAL